MAQVDPFVYPIPKGLQIDAEVRAYFEYLNRFLHDIWVRTGSGDDAIQNESIQELYPWIPDKESESGSDISNLFINRNQIQQDLLSLYAPPQTFKPLEIITIETGDTAFTTTASQDITCLNTSAAIVTLNANPEDGEEVIVARRDALVTINGAIDGDTTLVIVFQYDTPHLRYSASASEWCLV